MDERPRLSVLIARQSQTGIAFTVIDLLAWPYYQNCGWEFIGMDPESEVRWHLWRANNPEAA